MSMTFTKLFSSITESTVWGEPAGTRLVWITMLAMADRNGRVFASVPGMANRARVTLQECEQAIATFFAPDPYSRTPDHEGRRIEAIDGGWRLLNHAKYRDMRDEEVRREQNRAAKQRQRNREGMSAKGADSQPASARTPAMSAQADADADADATNSKSKGRTAPLVLPAWLPADAWQEWHTYRNSRNAWTARARELSLRTLTELWGQGHAPRAVIEQSIERGWTSLWPVKSEQSGAMHEVRRSVSAADRVAANIERARARRQQAEPIEGEARRLPG